MEFIALIEQDSRCLEEVKRS
ncbi:uncharacterized protein G2W53_037527 [Senna tora]|uniref:Uncharacterized protein n=1 Tax=Senna tora TaxID=362788 RepID=A0A834SKL3_9FABA|nr:uncharacterized protein G2W53_037527 [Senna tora]